MDQLGEIELAKFIRQEVDMRYGAMNFPVRPVLQELKEIAALGFDYVELAMVLLNHTTPLFARKPGNQGNICRFRIELLNERRQ
ncbi:MAG: hypothetical protein ACLPVO_15530 [Desulfomonilaceae bacterium]